MSRAYAALKHKLQALETTLPLFRMAETFLAPQIGSFAPPRRREEIRLACRAHQVAFGAEQPRYFTVAEKNYADPDGRTMLCRYRWNSDGRLTDLSGYSLLPSCLQATLEYRFEYDQKGRLLGCDRLRFKFQRNSRGQLVRDFLASTPFESGGEEALLVQPRIETLAILRGKMLDEGHNRYPLPLFLGPDLSRIDPEDPQNLQTTQQRTAELSVVITVLGGFLEQTLRQESRFRPHYYSIVEAWFGYAIDQRSRLLQRTLADRRVCEEQLQLNQSEIDLFPPRIRQIIEDSSTPDALEKISRLARDFEAALPNCPGKEEAAVCRSYLHAASRARKLLMLRRINEQLKRNVGAGEV